LGQDPELHFAIALTPVSDARLSSPPTAPQKAKKVGKPEKGDKVLLLWEGEPGKPRAFATARVVSSTGQANFAGGGRIGSGYAVVEAVAILDYELAGKVTAWADHPGEGVSKGMTSFTDSKVKVSSIHWKVPLASLEKAE
jgi:hypothetical protein